jgi:hypothetical protein
MSVEGRTRTSMPSAPSTSRARSAIQTCPNAVGCTWSVITRFAVLDDRVGLLDGAPGARAPEVERDRHHQHAVAAGGQRLIGERVVGGEGRRVPVGGTDVVDPGVQTAEVVAGAGRAPVPPGGHLLARDLRRASAVDRERGERQPEPARDPQRPRLQRDAPLQLAAAVGDRVAEGHDAQAAGAHLTVKFFVLPLPPATVTSSSSR